MVPASAYSGTMIAATPLFGGHYFVDLIAGAALTAVAVLAYGRIAADYVAGREAPNPASRASI
jgi:membrane-associated phospholipid phosphatase